MSSRWKLSKLKMMFFYLDFAIGYEEIFDIIIECLDGYEVTEDDVDDDFFKLYAEKGGEAYKLRIDYNAEEIKISAQETKAKKY